LSGYAPVAGVYDELAESPGCFREPSRRFVVGIDAMGSQGLQRHFEEARRMLRENGLLPSVRGDREESEPSWELDPLPLLISKSQWSELAAGLAQRAELLDAILADVYGPQRTLVAGVIPPELVFGNPDFLVPCHGAAAAQKRRLHFHACHLTRHGDGSWLVLADHADSPLGSGFALENRIVLSRVLPSDFHSLHVERLAAFFITLRETLQTLAPPRVENPRVVLLSPGPRSSRYFEDAYLARYLGYTLVEGGDLTVRGTTVYLKTLGGLLPVDVVLRCMADEDCDPLELSGDSLHGVPGLMETVRSGQVAVSNALGNGFLETPALPALLPELCRHLLGEDLKLPSRPTWWCGRPADWDYVRAHFDELSFRAAVRPRGKTSGAAAAHDGRDRTRLLEAVRRNPGAFVAQARIARSTAPVWNGGTIEPWYMSLRSFIAADRQGAYHVMPGGLARVAPTADGVDDALTATTRSKDVWILSDRPVASITLLRPQSGTVELRRSGNDLPSRVADNLYWLGRHVERAEGMVRHLRSCVVRMISELEPSGVPELTQLVRILSDDSFLPQLAHEGPELLRALEDEILAVIYSPARSGTLDDTIRSMYRTASIVRDRISADTWRIVNQLDLDLLRPRPLEAMRLGDALLPLNQAFNLLSALGGLTTESMTRGPGWRFVDMGRRLERALNVLRLLRKTLVLPVAESSSLLEFILEIADSSMTYRYRYLNSLQLAPLLDLLLTDETNPRSVGFQLAALADHVRQLPGKDSNPLRNRETRITIALQAELRLVEIENLAGRVEQGVRRYLDNFLADITLQLWQLSDSITHTYFTHTGPSRQLGSLSTAHLA
jgi:uncharacterized circularly permuted ATP-grasp superfamily protein/uncharacterized alpha-E superfamily protein